MQKPIVIWGEPEENPARFPCKEDIQIYLDSIAGDTMEIIESKWRKQLKNLSEKISLDVLKKLPVSEQKILRSMGNKRAGLIPDTFWGLRTFCKAYTIQEPHAKFFVFDYDIPILMSIPRGIAREVTELIRTILYAVIGEMKSEILLICTVPIEPGIGFRNQVQLQPMETVSGEKTEKLSELIMELGLQYMDDHYEESMEILSGLLQKDYIEYDGDYWIADCEQGIVKKEDFLTLLYSCGWLKTSEVHDKKYAAMNPVPDQPLVQMGNRYMDRLSGMKQSALWIRNALVNKENAYLRAMLEPLTLKDAELILRLAILLEDANYRVYSWKYEHRQRLFILAADRDHRMNAYAIAIGTAERQNQSEAYLKLRQKIRRIPTYKMVQSEKNLTELTLVLFTNE